LLLLGALALLCFGADSDLDGVPDSIDKCPNTPFLAIVDENGCAKSQLKPKLSYYLLFGMEYDGYQNTNDSQSVFASFSIKYNPFKLSVYSSLQNDSQGYKTSDLITSFYYTKLFTKTALKTGIKIYFPTYYNKKIDYAFYLKGTYFYKSFDFSISEKHKIYTEKTQKTKDTITLSIGKSFKKLYISPYFYTENSSYNTAEWTSYAGITLSYLLKINPYNKNLSTTIDYSVQTDNFQNYSVIGSLGYKF
jgi:hypothetical protein